MVDSRQEGVLKGILKVPLIIAAAVVILRVVVERLGGPGFVSSALSIVALHTILAPLYFAIRIGSTSEPRPYLTLIKLIGIYAVATRAMVLPVYWLARMFQWPESRFYGLWGPDVNPFVGYIAVPFVTAAFWIVASLVIGGAIASATLAIVSSRTKT
jgi:hypothetical protein